MDVLSDLQLDVSSPPADIEIYARTTPQVRGDDHAYLRNRSGFPVAERGARFAWADLFAGCGGISLGVVEACHELGRRPHIAWAVDNEAAAAAVFQKNLAAARFDQASVAEFLELDGGSNPTRREIELRESLGPIDLLVGGPPCQGHSDLNNFSRREDPKNSLYGYMARAARVLEPEFIIIENVQGTPHDKGGVFQRTVNDLIQLGYQVDAGLAELWKIGVAQKRRRHLLLASKSFNPRIADILRAAEVPQRDLRWAIGDLQDAPGGTLADTPAVSAPDTRKRIKYLFDRGLYELPNEQRPPCHRDKNTSYTSVYGRLKWDLPAQTITSGFYSMCMGRYVHPSQSRTLTAHEAARLQGFPDFFDFEPGRRRTALAKMIGNAVPMKLSYVIARELIRLQQGR